jgi:glycosidase
VRRSAAGIVRINSEKMSETQGATALAGASESRFSENMLQHLRTLYPERAEEVSRRILQLIHNYAWPERGQQSRLWDETDAVLITYGDSILGTDQQPLVVLRKFLEQYIGKSITGVHILPFFPFSSDDGFSVIDYRKVRPDLGDWRNIRDIAAKYRLMVDLVINHVSRESLWFYDFVADRPPARDYFIDIDGDTDVSHVTRPRNTPLLVPVNTHRGMRHVWATFSEDQIDVNFANPDVLLEYIDILLLYVFEGAQLIRLDAITYLWKRLGTTCAHLPETHQVVKLVRDILSFVKPGCILLTETNVPHEENISYFGNGDEAHMVYQFSLPPLVLHALNRGTSIHLVEWASTLSSLPPDCTYLNFTASHDGIGLRALEGILSDNEVNDLVESMHRFGGFVSMKANPDGVDTPYEINISLFDALQGTRRGPDQWQVERFIGSQAIMLSLKGIPAIYIHSLVATPNDLRGVELSGRTRSINRKKWQYDELAELLASENTPQYEVYHRIKQLLEIRSKEKCFHPDNDQEIIYASNALFVVLRTDRESGERLLCVHNVTHAINPITLKMYPDLSDKTKWRDLISGEVLPDILPLIKLQPYQVMWLREQRD